MDYMTSQQIILFMLTFVRTTVILRLLPIFGHMVVQPRIRIGLSFFISIILFPLVSAGPLPEVGNLIAFLWLILMEVAVGVVIGYFTLFIFGAISFAGSLIDTDMGFAMVTLSDPVEESVMSTATGVFLTLIFTILFLLFNGHYYLLMALQKSFEILPPGHVQFPAESLAYAAAEAVTKLFEIGLRLAAPIMVILFITSVALGIIAKTMPQMNIFFVGAPLKIGIGFLGIIVALPGLVKLFETVLQQTYRDIWKLLKSMAVT